MSSSMAAMMLPVLVLLSVLAPHASGATPATATNYTVSGRLVFSGNSWDTLLAKSYIATATAVQTSCAGLLGVSSASFAIITLAVGSLVVEYTVTSTLTSNQVGAAFSSVVSTGSTGWMSAVTTLYSTVSPSDSTTLKQSTITSDSKTCPVSGMDDGTCYVAFAGICLGVIFIVLLVVYKCCCRHDKDDPNSPLPAARSVAEQRRLGATSSARLGNEPHGDAAA